MNSFEELWGNEQIITNLKNAIENNTVNHAYIIDGAKGIGKTSLAKAFAKTLNCEKGLSTPCGECSSCIGFDSDNNPDVIYVTHKKSAISVEDIRQQVVKNIEVKPFRYKYKIFIIKDADLMNIQAQNAFLKTLEEPPEYGVFLLLCENYNKFLITILSRCVMLRLKPLSNVAVEKYMLERLGCSKEKAEIFSLFSQGNIGRAIEVATSEELAEIRKTAADIALRAESADLIELYALIPIFEKFKENIQEVLDVLFMIYRDVLVKKSVGEKHIIQKDKLDTLDKIAKEVSLRALINRCDAIFEAKKQLRQNANLQMTMEVMLLKLKEK